VIADFVTGDENAAEWRMVLVEEGPWTDITGHLSKLQDRLYDCLDAALDGQLAEKFPASNGKPLVIQVDCYNVPENDVRNFFDKFSKGIFSTPDYLGLECGSEYVGDIKFEINFDKIH